jgi:hypothetical protein
MNSRLLAKTRKPLSKQRLVLCQKIARFETCVLDAESIVLQRLPDAASKLVFAKQELAKLQKEMSDLNRPYSRQLYWAGQGFTKKKPSGPTSGLHKKLFKVDFSKGEV